MRRAGLALAKNDLGIIDELGYLPFGEAGVGANNCRLARKFRRVRGARII